MRVLGSYSVSVFSCFFSACIHTTFKCFRVSPSSLEVGAIKMGVLREKGGVTDVIMMKVST